MEKIRVPKPPPEAFHKHRHVTDLVSSQVAHFQHVAEKNSMRIDPEVARDVHTEGGAARFIASVTRSLHKGASAEKGKVVVMERGRGAVSESMQGRAASGTVHRIAAEAETPKRTKAGSGTASKLKKSVKKAAKKSAKKMVKKKGAAAASRTSSTGGKSAKSGKPGTGQAGVKAKSKPRKRS
jgi:hypothetical protein